MLGLVWPGAWFRGGPRSGWRLGEQVFCSPFYFCKSRERGRGYACVQGFYHDWPHLRLLIPEVSCHREGAVPRRNGAAMGALHPCIVTSAGGALQERLVSERTGPIGSGCTTALCA